MNDVLNDKAWLEKMMHTIRINQMGFGRSIFSAGEVHKPIHICRHPTATFYTAIKVDIITTKSIRDKSNPRGTYMRI